MKKSFSLLCFLLLLVSAQAQKGKLTLHFDWAGIEEGYDHTVKDEIYIDGKLVATTEEYKGSESTQITVKIKPGKHTVKTVSWTLYEGNWEQTRTDDEYSIDGWTEQEYTLGKKSTLRILYDLDNPPNPFVDFK